MLTFLFFSLNVIKVLSEFFNVGVVVGVKGYLKIKNKIFRDFEKQVRVLHGPFLIF